LVLPIHFPHPTVGRVEADGDRFHYRFIRDAIVRKVQGYPSP
jgi:hypothetical protein